MFVDLPVISPYIKSGKVRAIASPKRSVYFPDVPTTAEGGYPGVQVSNHYSLLLPARTPRDIVMKLHDAVAKTMAMPEIREKFTTIGGRPAHHDARRVHRVHPQRHREADEGREGSQTQAGGVTATAR